MWPLCTLEKGGSLVRWSRYVAGRADGTSRRMGQTRVSSPTLSPLAQAPLCRTHIARSHSSPWPLLATLLSSPLHSCTLLDILWALFPQRCSSLSSWTAGSHGHKKENCSFGLMMVEHLGSASCLAFLLPAFLLVGAWHRGLLGSVSSAGQAFLPLTPSPSAFRPLGAQLGFLSCPRYCSFGRLLGPLCCPS